MKNKAKKAIEKLRAIRFKEAASKNKYNYITDPKVGWNINYIKEVQNNIKIAALNCKGLSEIGKKARIEA